jgi:hypothetical protein
MVLTVSFALSRVTGLSCHPHRRKLLFANLTPASGRQDHTTSPSASSAIVFGAIGVHRIPLRVDDVAQRPSVGRDGEGYSSDLGFGKTEIFFLRGLDSNIATRPVGQISCPPKPCCDRTVPYIQRVGRNSLPPPSRRSDPDFDGRNPRSPVHPRVPIASAWRLRSEKCGYFCKRLFWV